MKTMEILHGIFRQSAIIAHSLLFAAFLFAGSAAHGASIPSEIKSLTETLRKLGEEDLANQLEKDIRSGRVIIGECPARATTGVAAIDRSPFTRHLLGSGTTDSIMTINTTILTEIASGNMENMVGWALTVRHEYIHMGQWDPKPTPEFENPAYRETIKTGCGWYGTVKTELEEALQAPPTKENIARVKELRILANAVGKQMSEVFNDMRPLIRDGNLAQDTWWTLDHGRAATLDEAQSKNSDIVKKDMVKIDAEIKKLQEKALAKNKKVIDKVKKDSNIVLKDKPKKAPQDPRGGDKALPAEKAGNLDMQGKYSGSVKMPDGSSGLLNITVRGEIVSGIFTEKYFKDLGPSTVTRQIKAPVSGKVDLSSGTVKMQAKGTIIATCTVKQSKPPVAPVTQTMQNTWNFTGSYTGSGFKGSTDMPWSVTKAGRLETKSQVSADKPAANPPPDLPNVGGTLTAADGSRTVLTYRQDASGNKVPVTTEYDRNGRIVRQTTVDRKGQTVPVK
jgi:hypothetical protein